MKDTRLCWLDIRGAGSALAAVVEEAVHQGIDGIVAADPVALIGVRSRYIGWRTAAV